MTYYIHDIKHTGGRSVSYTHLTVQKADYVNGLTLSEKLAVSYFNYYLANY